MSIGSFVRNPPNFPSDSDQPDRLVDPVSPPAAYLGGKRLLAKRLVSQIEAIPHQVYAEAFVGMGGVFFRRRRAPRLEVINDLNREVATLFRILQRHYVQFMEMMKFQLSTRAEFERLVDTDPATLTDLERAARFLYLQRLAFGGHTRGQSFGVSVSTPARFNITKLGPLLEDVHSRLAGVIIECLNFDELISRYDTADTLFYLDPPYWGGEDDYGKDQFAREDFRRLADQLADIGGHFILSINDVSEIREIFKEFRFDEAQLNYSIAKADGTKAQELIITNVDPATLPAAAQGGLF